MIDLAIFFLFLLLLLCLTIAPLLLLLRKTNKGTNNATKEQVMTAYIYGKEQRNVDSVNSVVIAVVAVLPDRKY